jgi:hypothetical protein
VYDVSSHDDWRARMARQRGYQSQDSDWRDLIWAAAAAALVTAVLVTGVALAWLVGGGPSGVPALSNADPVTPTPRAISFTRSTTASTPPPATEAPVATVDSANAAEESAGQPADLGVESAAPEATTAPSSAPFEAATGEAFSALAAAPWIVSGDSLVNEGSNAIAQRWLTLSPQAGPNVAVEAEIRVTSVLTSVCDQSFGIASGSPASGLVFGGGVIFPCSGGDAEARLTNVTQWESGYNIAPAIAKEAFEPGEDWHTYRFELRGKKIRLVVDGVGIVSGEADPRIDPDASDVEAGLWSQGVGIEVKRVTVSPLPS